MIDHLDHLVLTCTDPDATCRFYVDVLGMQRETFRGDRIALRFGNQKINLHVRLNDGLPFLPATSAHVREMLTRNLRYVARVAKLHFRIMGLVKQAKTDGDFRTELPNDVIAYSFYARTCDPAVDYLRLYSNLEEDDIIRHMLSVWFEGVSRNTPELTADRK